VKLWVGITDNNWFHFLNAKAPIDEINFWRPTTPTPYRKDFFPGMPFLFKLHAPDDYIVGGAFFLKFLPLPISLAWAAFGEANGTSSLENLRNMIGRHARLPPGKDRFIGCNILSEPFFFPRDQWIPSNRYLQGPIVSGKGFFDKPEGEILWREVTDRLISNETVKTTGQATVAAEESARYGTPVLVAPRIGQRSFRALVTDAYNYRCAISGERTLPVLQAAHIRPYAEGGTHELSNGLLLRSDLHTLFDQHYLTIEPTHKTLVVSRRIREQFENGRDYYALKDRRLDQPALELAMPSLESLTYHYQRFREIESA
jgi:putative restriction endonuclease